MAIHTIGGLPSRSHRRSELSQYHDSVFPVNAGIRNTDALLQSRRSLGRNILAALIEIALDHDASDETFTSGNLSGNRVCDLGLIIVILHRIAMRTINHHTFVQNLGLGHRLATHVNRHSIIIRARLATPEDNETIFISLGPGDRSQPILRHPEKRMRRRSGANCIEGNVYVPVRTIFEAHGEGQSRRQFTM